MYLYFLQNRKKIINKINSLVILFIHNLLKDGIKFIKRWDQMFSCQEKLESHFSYTFFFSDDCKFYSSVRTETSFHQFSFSLTEKTMIHFSEVSTVHKVSKDILNKYIHCDIIIATCDNKCIISRLMFVFHCCHKVLF